MVFSLSALWWRRIRGLWKLPDGRDWLRGELGLVLMGGAMLSKSLIQFSVDGWSCVPSLLFTWGQTVVEVMKIMVTSFRRSHAGTAALSAPSPAAGHRQPTPPLETPGHSLASLEQSLVGSLLLSFVSWCTQGFVCALKESVSQSCVNSGFSVVGLMATSSKRTYAIPRAPASAAGHCWPVSLQEILKLSLCGVFWCTQGFVWASERHWWVWDLILNAISPVLPSCWGFSFALGHGVSFFVGIQHSPVDGCSAVSCSFGVLTGEDELMSFYSAIFLG